MRVFIVAAMKYLIPPDSSRPPTLSTKALPTMSPVDPEWETLDPNPDLHSLFVEFNTAYFWGKLVSCEVKWSPRMTTCAGKRSFGIRS